MYWAAQTDKAIGMLNGQPLPVENGESNASISHPWEWPIPHGPAKAASRIEPQLSTMGTKSLYQTLLLGDF